MAIKVTVDMGSKGNPETSVLSWPKGACGLEPEAGEGKPGILWCRLSQGALAYNTESKEMFPYSYEDLTYEGPQAILDPTLNLELIFKKGN